MAEINTNTTNSRGKKGQPNRTNLRVDFTPMVDMNMLLITFFMFCTTLATPQVMDMVMPTKEKDPKGTIAIASKTTTLILGEQGRIYYYFGLPDYENPDNFMVTDYSAKGLRQILLDKNYETAIQMKELRNKRARQEITEIQFKEQMSELKKAKGGEVVIIKPTEKCVYNDLVNTLDEMQICGIGKYAVVELEEADKYLLENFADDKTKMTALK
ncbi:MAG TPA: biopolymer transporter ExbD [Dysgonomonas sp.]|nr:biopolymer transporter ExbD [Dysgonomonas sp.]